MSFHRGGYGAAAAGVESGQRMTTASERKPGIFAIRDVRSLITETTEEGHGLKKSVGALQLTAMGVGAIIGTGIFVVIGEGAGVAGPAVILSFILAAVACTFSALSYAELASAIPVSGSAYTYTHATLGEIVAWITTGTVEYRPVASSSAAHGLHDLAEELTAETIVVGSGRHATRQRLFVGSTAERLLAGSLCPIAVAPAGTDPPPGALGRIGVAYIDTPDGRAALDRAARLARRTGTPLRLYTVVIEADGSKPFLIGDDVERAFADTARETFEQSLIRAAESVPDLQVDWRILGGDVIEALGELSEVDVLFCGSRGYGPARRVLLGGVSARLVRSARRPVVVVPRSG